ncbi:MAG: SlyX family protein [bacterium]|nr:SlyX family protein [bacterium]
MSLEARIVDLEVRAAYQDKLVGELDEVVRELWTRVERLESLVKDLRQNANAAPIGPQNDPPPHY